jgi:hypothetical protein
VVVGQVALVLVVVVGQVDIYIFQTNQLQKTN